MVLMLEKSSPVTATGISIVTGHFMENLIYNSENKIQVTDE